MRLARRGELKSEGGPKARGEFKSEGAKEGCKKGTQKRGDGPEEGVSEGHDARTGDEIELGETSPRRVVQEEKGERKQ